VIAGRFRFRTRLIVAGGLTLAIVMTLAITGAVSYRLMHRSAAMSAAAAEASINLQLTLRAIDEIVLTQGTIPATELARKGMRDFSAAFPKTFRHCPELDRWRPPPKKSAPKRASASTR